MPSLDLTTLFFIGLTLVVFIQLYSVLGKRTESKDDTFSQYAEIDRIAKRFDPNAETMEMLIKRHEESKKEIIIDYSEIDKVAPEGTPLNTTLRELKQRNRDFSPSQFISGAKLAYENGVVAFNAGDRKTLRDLLSPEVFDSFVTEINGREARGETIKFTFVGVSKTDIIDAEMRDSQIHITLKIVSQIISAVLNKEQQIIEGNLETVSDVKDIWTFARDVRSTDPNWKLVGTESEN